MPAYLCTHIMYISILSCHASFLLITQSHSKICQCYLHQSRLVRAHGGSRIKQTGEETVASGTDGGDLPFASRSEHFPLILISSRICLRWQFAFAHCEVSVAPVPSMLLISNKTTVASNHVLPHPVCVVQASVGFRVMGLCSQEVMFDIPYNWKKDTSGEYECHVERTLCCKCLDYLYYYIYSTCMEYYTFRKLWPKLKLFALEQLIDWWEAILLVG